MLLKDARDEFLFDCECKHLAKGTIRNYKAETRFLVEFLELKQVTEVEEVKAHHIRDKLKRYLIKLTGDDYEESVREYVDSFYQEIKEKLESVRSDMYGMMKNEFASQKKPTRPELEYIELDDYAAEASETIQFAMLKDNIKSFVIGLEDLIGNRLIERTDDKSETVAAGMLNTYLNMVDSVSDMYVDYLDMFTKIKAFIE